MLKNFRSYQLALEFYREAQAIKAPYYLKDQLRRASSSIALNLSEGSAKESRLDRRRFYFIALGSIRECETLIEMLLPQSKSLSPSLDCLARHVYKLCQALS